MTIGLKVIVVLGIIISLVFLFLAISEFDKGKFAAFMANMVRL